VLRIYTIVFGQQYPQGGTGFAQKMSGQIEKVNRSVFSFNRTIDWCVSAQPSHRQQNGHSV
jgi:ABC-type transporter lipoprotein component MlaA